MGRRRARKKNPVAELWDFDALFDRALDVGVNVISEAIGGIVRDNQPQIDTRANTNIVSEENEVIQVSRGVEYIPPRKSSKRGSRG